MNDARPQEIDATLEQSWRAFLTYRALPRTRRAEFMHAIAAEIEALGDALLHTAHAETHLHEARLRSERARTCFQLRSYADASLRGDWLEARIDTADPQRNPPKPDLRKYNVPLGPVVVFGASNFPFAYSTAGGDTACALAAGCTVVVKAHPAHPETSDMVAGAIWKAAQQTGMPEGVFGHIHARDNALAAKLVQHPRTKAVGFTGSFAGGKALFDLANARPEPVPVFAEMGSVNPVFLLPDKLSQSAPEFARVYAASITQSMGQFCTNPGILIGIDSPALTQFAEALAAEMAAVAPAPMLHAGIAGAYRKHRTQALAQAGVKTLAANAIGADDELQGIPTLATVSGADFLQNPLLHQEVFGPYSILVRCKDATEMLQAATALRGQLTTSLIATPLDIAQHSELLAQVREGCGRLVFNGVPTGVDVVMAQQHGGPYPATTDSRFTAVGADGIRRFARPLSFQNWPDALLPTELQNANPTGIWRMVNNQWTREAVS